MSVNPFAFVFGVFVVLLALRSVVIVPDHQRAAVVRLGMYLKTLKPGFHLRIPFIDLVTKVDLAGNIPGWQTYSDKELDAAVESFVMTGVVISAKARGIRESSTAPSAVRSGPAVERLAAWLLKGAGDQTGVDLSNDPLAKTRIAERAASALEELRSSDSCEINLPFLTADATGPKNFSTTLTKDQLERILGSSLG